MLYSHFDLSRSFFIFLAHPPLPGFMVGENGGILRWWRGRVFGDVCPSRLVLASAGRCGAGARGVEALALGWAAGRARWKVLARQLPDVGFGFWCVCGCVRVCWVGFVRNKAGGAGVAYGTLTRRTGWRVAVRAWRRRGLAGRAAPASPFTEGRCPNPGCPAFACSFAWPPSQNPRHGDCLRRDRLTPISIYFWLGFFSLYGG